MSENQSTGNDIPEKGGHILDEKPGMHGREAYIWFFSLLIAALIALFGLIIPFLNLVANGTGDNLRNYLLSRTLVADFSLIFVLWGLGWLIGTIFNLIKLRRNLSKIEE